MLRSLLYTFFLLLVFTAADAQELSNKGKEFWVGYGYHQDMKAAGNALNDQDMRLYFTSDVAAAVKVEIPGVGWSKTYQVTANAVTESDPIPKDGGQDSRLNEEGTFNRGIHITSNQPIVAYAHIYSSSNSGASLLFPVETLGSDYYSLNFTQKANTGDAHSWAFVIATEDNTEVEITPSAKTLKHNAGQSFVVPLKKGEIFNLMGETTGLTGVDLTGTRIRSVRNGIQSCEKIAVFSGAGRVSINCDNAADAPSADNLIQQVFPRSAWGNKYLTVPTAKLSNNYFRIAVNDPSTVVTVGGVRLTKLERNFYYEIIANTPQSIVSDKPVMVAQYITSSDANGSKPCGNSFGAYGDPEMIYISPIEQTIDKITLNSTRHYQIAYHYINVIIKSSAVQSFRLDGVPGAGSFSTHAGDPAFSFATFEVKAGSHNLRADAGFNAIAYGYGETESYGYNAGTNIKDLNRFITIQNPYSPVDIPVTCKNTIFSPSLTLPYQPSSIIWDFADNPNLSPSQAIPISNPVVSTSYVKDGVTLYVYTLQTQFTFNGTGTFPVKVTTDNSSANSCNGQQVNTFDITVLPAPIADFTYTHSGCATDAATFKDASTDNGKPLYKWVWDFGDGPADTRQNPPKTFSAAATYNVKLTAINDIGCFGETTKPLIIDPQPVADFNFSSPACVNSPVTFTDASTIPSGSITKWYWNFGNGKTTTETSKAPITTMYETTGPKSVSLQVENSSGCKSAVVTKSITVYASPTVDFDLAAVCLPSGVAMFNNLSSISDGTAASLTFLWSFGDGGTSTDKNPSYPYKTTGPFSVLLKATSAAGCSKDSTKIVSNIYEQPKAVFTNSAKLCVPDSIYFTDNSTASNSSVTEWNWNFGDGTTSKLRNPAKKYAAKGSYLVTLSIRSAAGCISQTEQKTIIINEAPTAAFAISNSTCENQPVTITDQSKANSGSIQSWSWIFGDGTSTTNQSPNPFSKTYSIQGDYTIKLVTQTDVGCTSDTGRQKITVRPLPVTNFLMPEICVNDPFAAFTDSSNIPGSPGSRLTYSWNFGDQYATNTNPNTSTQQHPQHKYSVAGIYNVSLTTTSNTGCSSTITKPFTVNSAVPKADFKINTTGNICSNTAIEIENTSTVDIGTIIKIEITWDANQPGSVVTIDHPVAGTLYSHTYPLSNKTEVYQVRLRAYTGKSCATEKVIPVTVQATPKVTFTPVPAMCLNDTARSITQAKETSGLTGTFSFSGKGVSPSGLFSPSTAGVGRSVITYTYTSNEGCKDSASQTITVIANPTVRSMPRLFVAQGGSVVLDPVITGNVSSYKWTPPTFLDNANIRRPRSSPDKDITYRLTVTGDGGCKGYGDITVSFLLAPIIPGAFSPNGDGINDKWLIKSLDSYPNATVDVFNRYGKIVFSSKGYARPWDGTFAGGSLPVGVYYYIISTGNGVKAFTGSVTILK